MNATSDLDLALSLAEELESIARQAEHGALPAAVAECMGEEIADELRALKRHDIAKLDLETIEVLRSMPFFQDIALDDLANIVVRMSMKKAKRRSEMQGTWQEAENTEFRG